MSIRNTKQGAVNSHTVSGHVVQNAKVARVNSRVQQARFADPAFGTVSTLSAGPPNTDRRRFVVNNERTR